MSALTARRRALAIVLTALVLGGVGFALGRERGSLVSFPSTGYGEHHVMVDPGHGGEDGGGISADGAVESGINLDVSRKLGDLLELFGVPVTLLRTEDVSLHTQGAQTLREKKRSDLNNRVDWINDTENALLISIHQNIYPDSSQHGAQVFYARDPRSQAFAEQTQAFLKQLDPQNRRKAAKIPSSVYLMNHVDCPAILVECGFLSHPQEAKLLQDAGYQTRLALAVTAAYLSGHQGPDYEGEGSGP